MSKSLERMARRADRVVLIRNPEPHGPRCICKQCLEDYIERTRRKTTLIDKLRRTMDRSGPVKVYTQEEIKAYEQSLDCPSVTSVTSGGNYVH